jgi:hypothetical protein
MLIHRVSLYDYVTCVWYAVSAARIIKPIFHGTINSHQHFTHILTSFFDHLSNYERPCVFFQQDSMAVHTASSSVCYLETVFGSSVIISRRLWHPCFPDLNPCHFYLCGVLKDKVCTVIILALKAI